MSIVVDSIFPKFDFNELSEKVHEKGRFTGKKVIEIAESKIQELREQHEAIVRALKDIQDGYKERRESVLTGIARISQICTTGYSNSIKWLNEIEELKTLLSKVNSTYQEFKSRFTQAESEKEEEKQNFVNECGNKKGELLSFEQKEYDDSPIFQSFLEKLQKKFFKRTKETIYFAYAWPTEKNYDQETWIQPFLKNLQAHLKKAGFPIVQLDIVSNRYGANIYDFMKKARASGYVLLFGTKSLLNKYSEGVSAVCTELTHILRKREEDGKRNMHHVFPILLSGTYRSALPPEYERFSTIRDWRDHSYLHNFQQLFLELSDLSPEEYQTRLEKYWDQVCQDSERAPPPIDWYQSKREAIETCRRSATSEDIERIINLEVNRSTAVNPSKDNNFPKTNLQRKNLHPDFSGRKRTLEDIAEHFESSDDCVLFGLPGIGKTQIALHYAMQNADQYSGVWIVNCRDEGTTSASYTEIVEGLELHHYPENKSDASIRKWIHQQLENNHSTPWLLIFDDVSTPLEEYPVRGGKVLITTNKRAINKRPIWRNQRAFKDVDPLDQTDAIELLRSITGEKKSKEMEEVVRQLGGFPLALTLAGHYIRNSSSFKEFLKNYDPTDPQLPQDPAYENTLDKIWENLLEKINSENPLALEWLKICSYLDPSRLPIGWIGDWIERRNLNRSNAIAVSRILTDFAIFQKSGHDYYSMHPFLQRVIQQSPESSIQNSIVIIQDHLSQFHADKSETWKHGWDAYPHVYWLETEHLLDTLSSEERYKLLFSASEAAKLSGDLNQAIFLCQRALEIAQQLHPNVPHPDIADAFNNLGDFWREKGDSKQSIIFHEKSYEMRKQIHQEKSHAEIANSLNNLGGAWYTAGNLDKALAFQKQAYEMRKSIYKKKPHPELAISLNNLGAVFRKKNEIETALEYFRKSHKMRKELYSKDSIQVAFSKNSLGKIYQDKRDLEKAYKYFKSSYSILKQHFEEKDRPEIEASLNNLGVVCQERGYFQDALKYFTKSSEMCLRLYGESPHPSTVMSLEKLGILHKLLENPNESLSCFKKTQKMYVFLQNSSKAKEIEKLIGEIET